MPKPGLPSQTPEQLAEAIQTFLTEHPAALLLEEGRVLFDLRTARYTLATGHSRCTLQLWSEDRNLVRRVTAIAERKGLLRLATQRFGQTKPQTLELAGERDRRTPSTRERTRERYLRELERTLARHFPALRPDDFRTAMDLEKSFGPAYARGLLLDGHGSGTKAWAVIGVNPEESQATVDGILTLGILWLEACREQAAGKRLLQGLWLVLPAGTAALTLSRLPWLAGDPDTWQVFEHDSQEATLSRRDPGDAGNLHSHLQHLPNPVTARERFAEATAQVLALIPPDQHRRVRQHLRSAHELSFQLHGLEFARIRSGASANSFNRVEETTVGTGPQETPLTPESEPALRALVAALFTRRTAAAGDKRDPLYRLQPERWLESELNQDLNVLDPHLGRHPIHAQVGAYAAADRALLDLLTVSDDGRLAVLELKANEDLQLALQGLDYWIRVRWHHLANPENANPALGATGEFQRHGYFAGVHLSPEPPRLYLVAPALRIHPATETILRHLSPRVDWTLVAIDERWRQQIRVIWRKRSRDLLFP